MYSDTIREVGTRINRAGGITATATTIPVDNATNYRANGTIRIGLERIPYAARTGTSFTGATRGVGAVAHADNSPVAKYANETELIQNVFGHEAGHLLGLEDDMNASHAHAMVGLSPRGSTLGNGYWNNFTGAHSPLTAEFQVKE